MVVNEVLIGTGTEQTTQQRPGLLQTITYLSIISVLAPCAHVLHTRTRIK